MLVNILNIELVKKHLKFEILTFKDNVNDIKRFVVLGGYINLTWKRAGITILNSEFASDI